MIRRFSTQQQICRSLLPLDAPGGSGPVLYARDGQYWRDPGDHHFAVYGRTQKGKTTSFSTTETLSVIRNGECGIVMESKDCVFRATAHLARESHDVYCVDLSSPHTSPDTYNPLDYIAHCAQSSDPQHQDWAREEIRELTLAMVPPDPQTPFWELSPNTLLAGIIQSLLEITQDWEEINLDSVCAMLSQGQRKVARSTIMKELAAFLPWGLARQNLECYTNAAEATAGSIFSIASSALSGLAASQGVMDLLCNNSLSVATLDGTHRPFLIYVILSDLIQTYNTAAAILVGQLIRRLVRQANSQGGVLTRRVSFILEELGMVGRAIPSLPQLMSQCLGRGIRVSLILQSMSQLDQLFGAAGGAIIRDNVGVNVVFAQGDGNSLEMASRLCGTYTLQYGLQSITRPVLEPWAIGQMETGQALVLAHGLRYVTRLPMYRNLPGWEPPPDQPLPRKPRRPHRCFQLEEYVLRLRREHMDRVLNAPSSPPDRGKLFLLPNDGPPPRERQVPLPEDLDFLENYFKNKEKKRRDTPKEEPV